MMEREELWMIFKVAENMYAINSGNILSIGALPDKIAHVPDTASYVRGIIRNRGRIVTLLDIRTLFAVKAMENEHYRSMVITLENSGGRAVGIIVDEIIGVEHLGEMYHDSTLDKMKHSQLLCGVASREQGDSLMLLLDERRVLAMGKKVEVPADV